MKSKILDHEYPHQFNEGYEKTKNKRGSMHTLSKYSLEFVMSASNAIYPVLDIGCAYGVATIPALERGAKVYAFDMESEHLAILKERTPSEYLKNLHVVQGKFPEDLTIPDSSISAVLTSFILCFLSPKELEEGFKKINKLLVKGGKLFIVDYTAYTGILPKFISEYEKRTAAGDPWPGYIPDLSEYIEYENLPKSIHAIDPEMLLRVLPKYGFKVEKVEYFGGPEYPMSPIMALDGREFVGCIATKI